MKTTLTGDRSEVSSLIKKIHPPVNLEMANMLRRGDLLHLGPNEPSLWVEGVGYKIENEEWVRVIILNFLPECDQK